MKVLWITNGLLPCAANAIGINSGTGGGWIDSLLKSIKNSDIQIAVASSYSGSILLQKEIEGVLYFYLPFGTSNVKCNTKQIQTWKEIEKIYSPDVVHVHGTEYSNGIGYIRANGSDKVVVSIQGLMNGISIYEKAGMPFTEKILSITLGSIFRLFRDRCRYSFKRRAKIESEYLLKARCVIGRTLWDKSYAMTINPNIKYYECWEILRPPFYTSRKWSYNTCDKHTIFISGGTPWLKGLYFLVQAVSIVKVMYPDVKIYVAGDDFLHPGNIVDFQKMTIDQRCIYNKAQKLGVIDNIHFTGWLSDSQMCQQYLRANVFVSASTIENSSNAICEAQMLGCPVIASFVGGTPSLINDGRTGLLYRYDDIRMLAYEIISVFSLPQSVEYCEIETRHNTIENINRIRFIYNQVLKNKIVI